MRVRQARLALILVLYRAGGPIPFLPGSAGPGCSSGHPNPGPQGRHRRGGVVMVSAFQAYNPWFVLASGA